MTTFIPGQGFVYYEPPITDMDVIAHYHHIAIEELHALGFESFDDLRGHMCDAADALQRAARRKPR